MNSFIIEREKIESNAREIIRRAGSTTVIAVVKGRGYGFLLDEYIKILHSCGIRFFAVTEVSDAITIRNLSLEDTEILMLRSTALTDELSLLIENDVILTIGSMESATVANSIAASKDKNARVHIKIDTGMGRYGFLPNDTEQILSAFTRFDSLNPTGLYTHLYAAFKSKKATTAQINKLYAVKNQLEEHGIDCGMVHFANSAYLFKFREPLGDAVRIGSAFTGRIACSARRSGLSTVGHLESNICELRWLTPGATIGYGGAFKSKRAIRIAVVPVGYSDGFGVEKTRDTYRLRDGLFYVLSDIKRTIFKKHLYIKINNRHARVLGHIGMTHTVCDVTDISCNIGDKTELPISPLYASPDVYREFI